MIFRCGLCALCWLFFGTVLSAQDTISPLLQLSPDADYADHPAMTVASSGDVYVAWVSYDRKGADAVRLRRYTGGRWEDPITVSEQTGDY